MQIEGHGVRAESPGGCGGQDYAIVTHAPILYHQFASVQ
jgi:hypothetical protein